MVGLHIKLFISPPPVLQSWKWGSNLTVLGLIFIKIMHFSAEIASCLWFCASWLTKYVQNFGLKFQCQFQVRAFKFSSVVPVNTYWMFAELLWECIHARYRAPCFNMKDILLGTGILVMINIQQSWYQCIFMIRIFTVVTWHFFVETSPG